MRKIVLLFIILALIALPVFGLKASIGNARAIINVDIESGEIKTIERTILVRNVNDVPVNITLEPIGDLELLAIIVDRSFTLQPGEEKKAKYFVKLEYSGDYAGKIGVSFRTLTGEGIPIGLFSELIVHVTGPEAPQEFLDKLEEIRTREPESIPEPEEYEGEEEEPSIIESDDEDTPGVSISTKTSSEPREIKKPIEVGPWIWFIIILAVIVGIIVLILFLLRRK